jgi:hypothetical protein
MTTRLYQRFAVALLCGAVGLAGPSFAAGVKHPGAVKHNAAIHPAVTHPKHTAALRQDVNHGNSMAGLDLKEHQITAQLNRASLANSPQAELQTTMPVVASAETDDDSQ